MSNRIPLLLVVVGTVVAYFTVYFGDFLYMMMAPHPLPEGAHAKWFAVIMFITIGIGPTIIGISMMMATFTFHKERASGIISTHELEEEAVTFPGLNAVMSGLMGFICFACVFGLIAGPFTNYGPYPWYWASWWMLLPILALGTSIFVACYPYPRPATGENQER